MSTSTLDNRFILYDGHNTDDVQEWLMERRFESSMNHRNANLFAYPFGRTNDITVIRPREYVYLVKHKIRTISTQDLIQQFISALTVDNPSDFEIKMNLKVASLIYRNRQNI